MRSNVDSVSIVVPTMGDLDLLRCFMGGLRKTDPGGNYELRFGMDPSGVERPGWSWEEFDDVVFDYLGGVVVGVAKAPGMSAAVNEAASLAVGDWIVQVCDDMVFLPGWDDFPALHEDVAACFNLLEPAAGSFPPAVGAGDHPSNFDEAWACFVAAHRQNNGGPRFSPHNFFGSMVIRRSRWRPWPEWCDPYSVNDIAAYWEMYCAEPDLIFGEFPKNNLYHFVRGAVRQRPELRPDGELWQRRFVEKYGLSTDEAWRLIRERSVELWARKS